MFPQVGSDVGGGGTGEVGGGTGETAGVGAVDGLGTAGDGLGTAGEGLGTAGAGLGLAGGVGVGDGEAGGGGIIVQQLFSEGGKTEAASVTSICPKGHVNFSAMAVPTLVSAHVALQQAVALGGE